MRMNVKQWRLQSAGFYQIKTKLSLKMNFSTRTVAMMDKGYPE
jgi:hypothetical protein